ncbi:DegT/DnrJ/EryC1/StrS family aminotransferase [Uliginosibacterium gangwonense]|uniref:DegT/DnrJ/EryC1/StrS family aminotransferase n=1 Tax=Uliginosibacterium gangwonense TaxID=392736 RepID=UPI000367EF82|nr:DegT/DnrJ/EryC1/StrS family aminotransferase [Uliginosibacterium gangwonense]
MLKAWREIPPTAGLPLHLRDLLPVRRGDFATQAARFLGVSRAGLECSGTACLIVILSALRRLSPRSKVIVPAYTCPLVALAIAHCGLKTVLCDLAPNSFDLDKTALAALCDQDTLAVIPTHLAGRVADVAGAAQIAHACGALVVEDAAQAFGARIHGESIGLMGDAGFFSFAAGKGLSLYEGGLWVARDPALAHAIARVSDEIVPVDWRMEWMRSLELCGYAAFYRPSSLNYVYGIPLRRGLRTGNLEEAVGDVFDPELPLHKVGRWRQAVGLRALKRLPGFQAETASQAQRRITQLAALPGVQVVADAVPNAQGVWPSLMVLLPDVQTRDAAMAELWGAGLGVTRMFIHALHDYAYLRPWVEQGDYPHARDFADRSLTISNSPWLDDADFERILTVLRRCCG